MKIRRAIAIASAAALSLAGLQLSATAANADDTPAPDDPTAYHDFYSDPLSAPASLTDAVAIASQSDEQVIGYHYDNGPVVGEFFPGTTTISEFSDQFAQDYGTQPEITALVALTDQTTDPADGLTSLRASGPSHTLTNHHTFKAKPVSATKLKAMFTRASASRATNQATAAPLAAAATAAHGSWAPDDVVTRITRSGSHQYIENDLFWNTTTNNDTPDKWGLEIQTDLHANVRAGHKRGQGDTGCVAGYRAKYFLAKNYSFNSWSATSSSGKVGAGKPYADYNDLLDLCDIQAMTIGIRYPVLVPGDTLITKIDADTGAATSNVVGGELQLVHDDCGSSNGDGVGGLTDCMGVREQDPPASYHSPRPVLNSDRGWKASPGLCWESDKFGVDGAPYQVRC